jgi:hypothetical protein
LTLEPALERAIAAEPYPGELELGAGAGRGAEERRRLRPAGAVHLEALGDRIGVAEVVAGVEVGRLEVQEVEPAYPRAELDHNSGHLLP